MITEYRQINVKHLHSTVEKPSKHFVSVMVQHFAEFKAKNPGVVSVPFFGSTVIPYLPRFSLAIQRRDPFPCPERKDDISPSGTNCAPPTYVGE